MVTSFAGLPRIHSFDQAAEYLRVDAKALRKLMRKHGCHRKIGRRILFTDEDLRDLLGHLRDAVEAPLEAVRRDARMLAAVDLLSPPRPPTRTVYFVQRAETGPIKIGSTGSIRARLKALQTGWHEPLRLLAILRASPRLEVLLHRRFAESRLAGEWFSATPELLALVRRVRARNDRERRRLGIGD